jgi:hypothetical protein
MASCDMTCCITHRVWLLCKNETAPNAEISVLKDERLMWFVE